MLLHDSLINGRQNRRFHQTLNELGFSLVAGHDEFLDSVARGIASHVNETEVIPFSEVFIRSR